METPFILLRVQKSEVCFKMFKIKRLCPGSMLEREIAEISCHITGKDLTPDSVIPAKPRTMSPPYLHTPDSWCSLFFLNIALSLLPFQHSSRKYDAFPLTRFDENGHSGNPHFPMPSKILVLVVSVAKLVVFASLGIKIS